MPGAAGSSSLRVLAKASRFCGTTPSGSELRVLLQAGFLLEACAPPTVKLVIWIGLSAEVLLATTQMSSQPFTPPATVGVAVLNAVAFEVNAIKLLSVDQAGA